MTEEELRGICTGLRRVKQKREKLDDEEGDLFSRLNEIADDQLGEAESFRYVDAEAKWVVGRTFAQNAPRVNVAELEAALGHDEWLAVTRQVRELDMQALEQAAARDPALREKVAAATETPAPTRRKLNQAAGKTDLARTKAVG